MININKFKKYVKKHFNFLTQLGFKFINVKNEYSIDNVIGITNGKIEFIVGFDRRENCIDTYIKNCNSHSKTLFPIITLFINKFGYRGGYLKVEIDNPIEQQIAKDAQLLKQFINKILDLDNILEIGKEI